MAFDEYYHFGIIQAYSKVWLPWSVQQPIGPATLGAVTSDGSYLFHYLMSFPYRVITHFTSSQMAQIITLRLIDVVIVLIGLYVYRKLLLRLGMSQAMTQLLIIVIVLLPVTTFLAGQLTYDTLFFTMTGITLLALVKLTDTITRQHQLPLAQTAVALALLVISSQVKYAFLPMALASGLFFVVLIVLESRSKHLPLWKKVAAWRTDVLRGPGMFAVGILLLSSVFFVQRYGVNAVQYKTPVPDCSAVIDYDNCLGYDPYGRNESYKQIGYKNYIHAKQIATYPGGWFIQMVREMYFTVGPRDVGYPTGRPLQIAYAAGFVIAIGSIVALIVGSRRLLRSGPVTWLLMAVTLTYIGFLFAQNYQDYLATGVPVAIHGRYILPLLPIMGYLVYVSIRSLARSAALRTTLFGVTLILLTMTLYGGGIAPFVIRSSDNWYWSFAVPTSRVVRSALWPVMLK